MADMTRTRAREAVNQSDDWRQSGVGAGGEARFRKVGRCSGPQAASTSILGPEPNREQVLQGKAGCSFPDIGIPKQSLDILIGTPGPGVFPEVKQLSASGNSFSARRHNPETSSA